MTIIERERAKRIYIEHRTEAEADQLLLEAFQKADALVACRPERGSGVTYINPRRYLGLGYNLVPYLKNVLDQIQHSKTAKVVRKRVENGRIIYS